MVGCVTGASIVNEFFHNDSSKALEVLRLVRSLFPDVPFVVFDYYGLLGEDPPPTGYPEHLKSSLLHDGTPLSLAASLSLPPPPTKMSRHTRSLSHHKIVVQAISGQGIPPSSLKQWERLYREAGYHIEKTMEYPPRSFCHICMPQ